LLKHITIASDASTVTRHSAEYRQSTAGTPSTNAFAGGGIGRQRDNEHDSKVDIRLDPFRFI
jgi:hypothetical protein